MTTVYYKYPQGPEEPIGYIVDSDWQNQWILVQMTNSQLQPIRFHFRGNGLFQAENTTNLIPLVIDL